MHFTSLIFSIKEQRPRRVTLSKITQDTCDLTSLMLFLIFMRALDSSGKGKDKKSSLQVYPF